MNQPRPTLRLRMKHSGAEPGSRQPVDPVSLIDAQSILHALLGALLALIVLNGLWVYSAMIFDRFFPWFSIIQGLFVGRAVQRFGRGLDWRFPLLAALVSVAAALTGSFAVALYLTGREFYTGVLPLIGQISWHTISTFLTREFGPVGLIYAFTAAAIAAFFANRRLDRYEALALRKLAEAGRT
jgi:hypothetical protein